MTKEEMQELVLYMNKKSFLADLWTNKEEFFNPKDKEVIGTYYHSAGLYIIYILQGELEKATELVDSMQESGIFLPMKIVDPTVTQEEFFRLHDLYAEEYKEYAQVTITAGRPYILNGFKDLSSLGYKLEENRARTITILNTLYGANNSSFLYDICLAEYYYQVDKCYEAEILTSRAIQEFSDIADMRCLFAGLFQQLQLLIVNNQCPSIAGYFKDMRAKLSKQGNVEFMDNLIAMEAWFSSYEGNYEIIYNWMKNNAPDEYGDFNMLDLFRYTVKLRCYLIQENHIALIALVERLRPLLIKGHRQKDLCLIDCILAMDLHSQGKKEEAFEALERGLKIARKNGYNRLAADEGSRMLQLLLEYYKEHPEDEYILSLISSSRKIAIHYPYYLKTPDRTNMKFSEIEKDILYLLEQGKNNEEIAACYLISVNTVKYHLKKIYSKLNVKSANAAVWQAKVKGIIK